MVNIALLDDHIILFEAIKSVFKNKTKYTFVKGFTSLEDIISFIKEGNVIDILLLDLQIEDHDGIEFCKKLKQIFPQLKIIIFTSHLNKNLLTKSLGAGASGYMIKNISGQELINGIETVLDNRIYIHEKVAHLFYSSPDKKANIDYLPKLTKREKEILKLIMEQNTSKQIAEKLFISLNTVEVHRSNIFIKTGAKNVAGLITLALEKNLI